MRKKNPSGFGTGEGVFGRLHFPLCLALCAHFPNETRLQLCLQQLVTGMFLASWRFTVDGRSPFFQSFAPFSESFVASFHSLSLQHTSRDCIFQIFTPTHRCRDIFLFHPSFPRQRLDGCVETKQCSFSFPLRRPFRSAASSIATLSTARVGSFNLPFILQLSKITMRA